MLIDWGRHSHRIGLVTALIALGLSFLFAASAAAEVRSGSGTDPVDGYLPGGLDLLSVSADYDTSAGTITARLSTRDAPEVEPEAGLAIGLGTLQNGACEGPFALVLGFDEEDPFAAWEFAGSQGTAQMGISGTTTTLSVTAPVLASQSFNCAKAFSVLLFEGKAGFLDAAAPIQLVGPPPPPPPPSDPAPPAPTPAPAPAPKVARVAKLAFPSKAITLHRNAWKKVKVKITNTGNAAAAKVFLKIGKAKGIVVKPKSGKLKLRSIAAGKSRVASFKVRLTKKAKATSKLPLAVAGAKGVKASGSLTIKAPKKPVNPKKGKGKGKKEGKEPSPMAGPPPLAEKIFYRLESHPSESASLAAITFVDGTWAYNGMPSGGLPNCTTVTGGAETEGCVKYTYDPNSGAVGLESIGSGKITSSGSLEIGEKTYSPTAIPAAGTRLQVEQEYVGFYGLCGPFSTCTTWHEYLTLTNAGEFVLSRQSLTTSDGPGSFVATGSYPPDQRGTYEIEPKGRIHLAFADGTSQTKTIAILLNKEGKPDPVTEGLLLDSAYFTFANSD